MAGPVALIFLRSSRLVAASLDRRVHLLSNLRMVSD